MPEPVEDHVKGLGGFNKLYSNIKEQTIKWTGYTSQVDYVATQGPNFLTSPYNWKHRETSHLWQAAQLHWHAGSEHTVDGKRFPLELHVVHTPVYKTTKVNKDDNNDYIYAVLGVIFDTEKTGLEDNQEVVAAVDALFDSLKWDDVTTQPKADEVKIGDFLNLVDARDRWTYEGSLTTPPCSTAVQWNVVRQRYPIKQKHVDLFLGQLKRQTGYSLNEVGNFREVQAIDDHNVQFVIGQRPMGGAMVPLIILIVLVVVFLITTIFFWRKASKAASSNKVNNETVQLADYDTSKSAAL